MIGIEHVWNTARLLAMDSKDFQESYLVIYSNQRNVVDEFVDAYLDVRQSFRHLMDSQNHGDHSLFAAPDLTTATDMLINLRRRGLVAKVNGAACILQVSLDIFSLNSMIESQKDFRPYLSEIGNSIMATQKVRKSHGWAGSLSVSNAKFV